ncbi:unnamed protein product [Protopolystoma xenopodis]|uniref:Uncharacterized protein n=1 Tax=Protopolystoma xenopodis TaxID=117903 RepID=A0A448XK93_9PLAT|nr:unnamed protein product [Protopolystoma xenopodis]
MIPCSDEVRPVTDESLAPFHRNRRRLPRKQRQRECSSKANRRLVKRNPPSSSGRTDLRISSPNAFILNVTTGSRHFIPEMDIRLNTDPLLALCITNLSAMNASASLLSLTECHNLAASASQPFNMIT